MIVSASKPISIAVIAAGLAPYRIPLLNHLNALPNFQVTALLCYPPSDTHAAPNNLQAWNFPYHVFTTHAFALTNKWNDPMRVPFSPGLLTHLMRQHYDVVIALGWTMPNTFIAWLQRKLAHQPIVVWDESIPHPPGKFKQRVMPFIKRYMGSFDGWFAASSWCVEYLVELGAARERTFLFPQVTDNAFFRNQALALRGRREELKRALGIQTKFVILFVGRFITVKAIPTLLQAFEQVAAENADVSLLLVGHGPLEEALCAHRADSLAKERIFIHPFVPQQQLPEMYALADLFVLPSYNDTFGVVIAEAMASGLPIVASSRVGAVADLVRDGENGRVVPPGDAASLANALAQILNDDALRQKMGARASERIALWNVDAAAAALTRFLDLYAFSLGTVSA